MALAWMWKNNIISRLPAAVKLLLVIVLAAGILVFLFIEGLIISRFHSKGEPGPRPEQSACAAAGYGGDLPGRKGSYACGGFRREGKQ